VGLLQRRELAPGATAVVRTNGAALVWEETNRRRLLLAIDAPQFLLESNVIWGSTWQTNRIVLRTSLAPHSAREFVIRLPSPPVPASELETFLALDYGTSRATTLKFWSNYVARGAQFVVPEEAVNELFRANLWHALRLPRRRADRMPGSICLIRISLMTSRAPRGP